LNLSITKDTKLHKETHVKVVVSYCLFSGDWKVAAFRQRILLGRASQNKYTINSNISGSIGCL
jgi:hypothetical protein